MVSDSTTPAPEGSTGLSGPHGDECETIGEFCLLHGWPQRPIDFTLHFKGS